jgi:hypothetical protein
MNILDTYTHCLRFTLDSDATLKYVKKFKNLKISCEWTDNEDIVNEIKFNCRLESNKNLPYLDRCEGGLGGNDNTINKQIRFRFNHNLIKKYSKFNNDILLFVYNTEHEKWTYEELDDIVRSFTIVLNKQLKAKCIKSCIELTNNNMEDDE